MKENGSKQAMCVNVEGAADVDDEEDDKVCLRKFFLKPGSSYGTLHWARAFNV